MKAGDKTIEWDSEVLADEPAKRIAWRSVAGESNNAGEVIFETSPEIEGLRSPSCRNFAWAN